MNKLKRYILFLIGLFVNALGVSLVTKASLGTSPISSIPYVLSLNFPFTLGNFTIVFSILLIVLQILILRKNFKLENILQIPVSIAFGYFIDLTMYMLFWINPQNYFVKMIALLAGCLVLGLGVYLEVLADVVMLPGESFVRAIVQTWNTNFGTTKIVFDCSIAGWIYCQTAWKKAGVYQIISVPGRERRRRTGTGFCSRCRKCRKCSGGRWYNGKIGRKAGSRGYS